MTCSVARKLNAGMVFETDSHANAGLNPCFTDRKTIFCERPGDPAMVLLSADNLFISESSLKTLQVEKLKGPGSDEPLTL